jgi:hypothetical protein
MSYHGASPGEGPRNGWHGNEDWDAQATRQRWETYAAEAGEGRDVNQWMTRCRPAWLDRNHGEERAQQRQDSWNRVQADGYEVDWSGVLNEWSPTADTSANTVDTITPQPARGSAEEWTAVVGSSTVATNFRSSSLADNRWETFDVASAQPVTLNIGVGMVEQPLSRPQAATRAAGATGPTPAARLASPGSGGRHSANRPPCRHVGHGIGHRGR